MKDNEDLSYATPDREEKVLFRHKKWPSFFGRSQTNFRSMWRMHTESAVRRFREIPFTGPEMQTKR
jgi:hypothetical protein